MSLHALFILPLAYRFSRAPLHSPGDFRSSLLRIPCQRPLHDVEFLDASGLHPLYHARRDRHSL
jgi:hypothetical protein